MKTRAHSARSRQRRWQNERLGVWIGRCCRTSTWVESQKGCGSDSDLPRKVVQAATWISLRGNHPDVGSHTRSVWNIFQKRIHSVRQNQTQEGHVLVWRGRALPLAVPVNGLSPFSKSSSTPGIVCYSCNIMSISFWSSIACPRGSGGQPACPGEALLGESLNCTPSSS